MKWINLFIMVMTLVVLHLEVEANLTLACNRAATKKKKASVNLLEIFEHATRENSWGISNNNSKNMQKLDLCSLICEEAFLKL